MYEDHPSFDQPPGHSYIWRYMDFTKFVFLLETSFLYFTRSDKFEDPYEGSLTELNISARYELGEELATLDSRIVKSIRKHMAINCWHVNQLESVAMWKLYLKSNEGIAVRSTVKRLQHAITDEKQVYIGLIEYIDYKNQGIDRRNKFHPFLRKRLSFEHEKELRAIIQEIPYDGDPEDPTTGIDYSLETIAHGLNVKVDVEELIESVYVSPDSPEWLFVLIESVVKRYGYNFEVKQSEINVSPLF